MPSKALIRQKVKGSLVSWWRLSVRVRTNLEISNPPLFSSVTQFCPTLCDLMDCSIPSFPVHHQHPELVQTHVHRVGDTIQPPHPLLSPSPPTSNLSQHQGLFQGVSSSHQVAKVLELQHQSSVLSLQTISCRHILLPTEQPGLQAEGV